MTNTDSNNLFEGFSGREDFLKFKQEREISTTIIEEQKTFIWTRVFLREEDHSLKSGDKVFIQYVPSGEILETIFGAYDKKSTVSDKNGSDVREYDPEDDMRVLCLMVDLNLVNKNNNDIPFIKTLFKQSIFFEYQLLKLNELKVYSNNKQFEYYNIDFGG